ncbi:MAG: 50S ribosomal protein L25 [Candidatus Krumholzibacteria bacterium]|nr:50S ribosomal protein L25 [Candidatus Krumholzibacteria bacterium]
MALIKMSVYPRETTGKNENRRTRARGFIPAVFYGHHRAAVNVQLDCQEFTRIRQKTAGRSVIYDLQFAGGGEEPMALVRELQQHPVSDVILHVDLFEIPRGEPVTIDVALVLEGEPACVKFKEGEVLQLLDTVELSCLPRELPESVRIDVSNLKLNDKLFVKDLVVPVGKIMDDPETQVLVVKPASLFAEEEAAPAATEGKPEGADTQADE